MTKKVFTIEELESLQKDLKEGDSTLDEVIEIRKEMEEKGIYSGGREPKLYDNFFLMADDIIKYIKESPNAEIIQKDDPMHLRIGYQDAKNTDKLWQIGISKLRMHMTDVPENSLYKMKVEILKKALGSQEGKENVIRSFYNSATKTEE